MRAGIRGVKNERKAQMQVWINPARRPVATSDQSRSGPSMWHGLGRMQFSFLTSSLNHAYFSCSLGAFQRVPVHILPSAPMRGCNGACCSAAARPAAMAHFSSSLNPPTHPHIHTSALHIHIHTHPHPHTHHTHTHHPRTPTLTYCRVKSHAKGCILHAPSAYYACCADA